MKSKMEYWERKEKLFKYIEGVRQFFPLAQEQLDIISRILDKYDIPINNFLDLGCGDGFLGNFIHRLFPESHGVFIDCSQEMINKAKERAAKSDSEYIVQDFGEDNWFNEIKSSKKFDLIISGYSIHHIENDKKKRLYKDIYCLLNQQGIFLNLEHVKSTTETIEDMFNELFLDNMSAYHENIGDKKSRDEIKNIYYDPQHKILNKLESVELQCKWLNDIGFKDVDCYLKIFELALFGGIKV
ncbi:class I SAM-dependent methyltransferase [Bacteroidota bacterium]